MKVKKNHYNSSVLRTVNFKKLLIEEASLYLNLCDDLYQTECLLKGDLSVQPDSIFWLRASQVLYMQTAKL